MPRQTGIFIAITAGTATDADQLQIGEIILDPRAKLLLERRAREEGISVDEAFETTLRQALNEHIEQHTPREWWSVQ